eukprot:4484429-Pyramimonas_sp.AAC.1
MTAARVKKGEKAYTIEDMRDACDIHDHSIRTGQAGRKKWWFNTGRLDRGTRQERGFITIALPRGDGTREKVAQRKLAVLASIEPAMGSTDQRGVSSGIRTDPTDPDTHSSHSHGAMEPRQPRRPPPPRP